MLLSLYTVRTEQYCQGRGDKCINGKIIYAFTYFLCRRYQVQISYICTRLKKNIIRQINRGTRKKKNTTIITKFISFTYYCNVSKLCYPMEVISYIKKNHVELMPRLTVNCMIAPQDMIEFGNVALLQKLHLAH